MSDPDNASVSLKALADDVGYNSTQVFHKAFKEETGVTPGIYKTYSNQRVGKWSGTAMPSS